MSPKSGDAVCTELSSFKGKRSKSRQSSYKNNLLTFDDEFTAFVSKGKQTNEQALVTPETRIESDDELDSQKNSYFAEKEIFIEEVRDDEQPVSNVAEPGQSGIFFQLRKVPERPPTRPLGLTTVKRSFETVSESPIEADSSTGSSDSGISLEIAHDSLPELWLEEIADQQRKDAYYENAFRAFVAKYGKGASQNKTA